MSHTRPRPADALIAAALAGVKSVVEAELTLGDVVADALGSTGALVDRHEEREVGRAVAKLDVVASSGVAGVAVAINVLELWPVGCVPNDVAAGCGAADAGAAPRRTTTGIRATKHRHVLCCFVCWVGGE